VISGISRSRARSLPRAPPFGPLVYVDGAIGAVAEPQRTLGRRIGVDTDQRVERKRWRGFPASSVAASISAVTRASIAAISASVAQLLTHHDEIAIERIVLGRPTIDLSSRHVRLVVVFRVPFLRYVMSSTSVTPPPARA
jgi:hypothetical protein